MSSEKIFYKKFNFKSDIVVCFLFPYIIKKNIHRELNNDFFFFIYIKAILYFFKIFFFNIHVMVLFITIHLKMFKYFKTSLFHSEKTARWFLGINNIFTIFFVPTLRDG